MFALYKSTFTYLLSYLLTIKLLIQQAVGLSLKVYVLTISSRLLLLDRAETALGTALPVII